MVAEVYRKLGWDRDSLSRHEPNGHNIAVGFDNARNYHFHCYLANSPARCFSIFIVHEVCCWSCAHQYCETFWLSLLRMSLSARSVLFSVDPFRRYHCLCDVLLYCFGIFVGFRYHLSMAGSF